MKTIGKKGLYEFILTKSVMLIFILGLVSALYALYTTVNKSSATQIADSEAQRLAKEIDDAIGYLGMQNTVNIPLERELKVGKTTISYNLEIRPDGLLVIRFLDYPYQDTMGSAKFGKSLTYLDGSNKVDCTWDQIMNGALLTVTKQGDYNYIPCSDTSCGPDEGKLFYRAVVTIDASESCLEQMRLEEKFQVE